MSTRRAKANGSLAQQRYSSSPEIIDQLGLNGTALAARVELLRDPELRSLLLFLQGLSIERGIAGLAEDILAAFPERFGSATMRKLGLDADRIVTAKQVIAIRDELGTGRSFPLKGERDYMRDLLDERGRDEWDTSPRERSPAPDYPASYPMADFIGECRKQAEGFPDWLKDLCLDPKRDIRKTALPWFDDIIGALFQFQADYCKAGAADCVMTKAAEAVFKSLSKGTRSGNITMIEGREGVGKTEAAKAWCKGHAGLARYINLVGITNRTTFFRTVARALGVGAGYSRMANDMQSRVEAMIHRTKLMLVIDESQYLLPGGERISKQPELINWIYTACSNFGVPVALLTTSLFGKRLAKLEQQVVWNSGQFKRRVNHYTPLPEPTRADLEAVARKHLPKASQSVIVLLRGYAVGSHFPFSDLVATITDARDIAAEKGRADVTYEDVEAAIYGCRVPSDKAKTDAFTLSASPRKRGCRPTETREIEPPQTQDDPMPSVNRLSGVELHTK